MNATGTKILCCALAVVLSLVFGFLPFLFARKVNKSRIGGNDEKPVKSKNTRKNAILAFLLNFGGGVLLANCFCHWLPEVREGKKCPFSAQIYGQ